MFGVEGSSPSKDQGLRLTLATTTPDDEVPAAAHGPRLSRGVPIVRKGSGGLPAPVLCLPLGPGSMAGGEHRLPRGDFGGGIRAVSRRQNIPSQS